MPLTETGSGRSVGRRRSITFPVEYYRCKKVCELPSTASPRRHVASALGPGETLSAGQYIDASNGQYRLWMSPNGNLVLYAGSRVLWSTRTHGNPGARAVMQRQGNLVVYSRSNVALWYTRTWDHPGAALTVQPDGNLVLYHYNHAIWATGTLNSRLLANESLKAGQYLTSTNRRYRLQMNPDGNLVLYAGSRAFWDTHTWGNRGARAVMQPQGNLVVYSRSNVALWYTRTWDHPGAALTVQSDGNLVLYHYNHAIWATGAP